MTGEAHDVLVRVSCDAFVVDFGRLRVKSWEGGKLGNIVGSLKDCLGVGLVGSL